MENDAIKYHLPSSIKPGKWAMTKSSNSNHWANTNYSLDFLLDSVSIVSHSVSLKKPF